MSFYGNLTNTAASLLAKYGQGVVEIGRPVTTEGANEYDPPTTTPDYKPVNAVVKGVSQKYVDGVNIVSSDREVLTQSPVDFDAAAGDKIRIDGKVVAVLMIEPIPAAGSAVATRFVVR